MPDPNIRTNADLTRAQAYEEELKREIAQAKGFGTNYTAYETRLKGVRADIEKYRAAHAALEKKRLATAKKSPTETLADLISSLASGPLGFIQRLLQADLDRVQVEPVGFAGRIIRVIGNIGVARAGIPFRRRVHIPAEDRGRDGGHHRISLFLGLRYRNKADSPDGGQTQCPFIKLHLVPPMLV